MGIPGAWTVSLSENCWIVFETHSLGKILHQALQTCSLTELAFVEGFESNWHGVRTLKIGVDARYELLPCPIIAEANTIDK